MGGHCLLFFAAVFKPNSFQPCGKEQRENRQGSEREYFFSKDI
jgi:hypothetical protein